PAPAQARAPPPRGAATTTAARGHTLPRPSVRGFTRPDGNAPAPRPQAPRRRRNVAGTGAPSNLSGQRQERVEQDAGAALDGLGVAGLVHAVALAAARGAAQPPGVGG